MMKNLISAFLLSLVFFYAVQVCSAHDEPPKTLQEKQKIENFRIKYRDAGIRKVVCHKYNYLKGERQLPKLRAFESNYDTNGCITEMTSYRNDTLIGKSMNYYNAGFQLVSVIDFNDGRTYSGVDRYEYNESGLILEITGISPANKIMERLEYLYNAPLLTIQLNKYDSAGKVEYSIEYKYANDLQTGACISIVKKDRKGTMIMRVESVYNADGTRREKRIYKADNRLDYSYHYTYTPSGDFDEISEISGDGTLTSKDKYAYNEKGFVTSVTSFNAQNEVQSIFEYTYYLPAK